MTAPRIVAILLAAGGGRRFGGRKQLAELEGRPLVVHALDALLDVAVLDEVVVVVGADGERVAAAVTEAFGDAVARGRLRTVTCTDWFTGMAASLRTGIAAAEASGADLAVLALADQPRMTASAVRLVLEQALAEPDAVVRAAYDGVAGHPAVFPAAIFGALDRLRGDVGARELLADPAIPVLHVEARHLADPVDVDTPEALEALTR